MVLKWGNIWLKLGCAWFFLLISPTSSIVPLNDLAVEHRMYLPMSLGLCLISGWLISCAKKNKRIYFLVFIVLMFGVLVGDRNQSWTSEIALWSDSAKKNPNSSRAQNNLGKAYYEVGKLKLARTHLEKSVFNISEYTKTKFNIKDPKKFIERKNIINKTFQDRTTLRNNNISINADLAEPHYNLASVYLDLGQLDVAEIQYQSALKINPNYYPAELGMGSLKNMKGEYEGAVDHFIKSISLMKKATGQADYALARLNLGEIYAKTQLYNKAIIEFNRALKANPSMFLAHYNLGTAYMLKGKFSKAELSLKAALKIKSNHEPAIFNLARVYQNKKQWINSNEVFNEFIKIKGPDPFVYSEIAWNNLMSGNMEQASTLYEKVINYKPNHKVALINLAKINYNLGKFKIAQVYIERVLKLDLTEPQSDDLNKLLKTIKSLNS
jgi:tetratricopeptide (TPR) repeat protein